MELEAIVDFLLDGISERIVPGPRASLGVPIISSSGTIEHSEASLLAFLSLEITFYHSVTVINRNYNCKNYLRLILTFDK